MLICPELETVFILVPRTGSGSLYREILRTYPKSMLLYRHMEADGVPQGYDRWQRVGFVRHPAKRLYSLYRFMQTFGGGARVQGGGASADAQRIRRQVGGRTFAEWLTTNIEPWTMPCDINGNGDWWPVLSKRDPAPENRRSQSSYLRPDLGTQVHRFEDLQTMMRQWGLNPDFRANAAQTDTFEMTKEIDEHLQLYCSWDLSQDCKFI